MCVFEREREREREEVTPFSNALKKFFYKCAFFFRGELAQSSSTFFSIVFFLTCTRPNRSSVGAIDKLDQSEQVYNSHQLLIDSDAYR